MKNVKSDGHKPEIQNSERDPEIQEFQIDHSERQESRTDQSKDQERQSNQLFSGYYYEMGAKIYASLNSSFLVSYSHDIMVPLGWIGGSIGFTFAIVISLYTNMLITSICRRRQKCFKELVDMTFGRQIRYITRALLYMNLFIVSSEYIINGLHAIEALLPKPDHMRNTQARIYVAAMFLPFIHLFFRRNLRRLCDDYRAFLPIRLFIAIASSVVLTIISFILYEKDFNDATIKNARDYKIPGGNIYETVKIFSSCIGLLLSCSTRLFLDIQANLPPPLEDESPPSKDGRPPLEDGCFDTFFVVLAIKFLLCSIPVVAFAMFGYCVYGSKAESNIFSNAHDHLIIKLIGNVATLIQSVFALQLFASPVYEIIDPARE